MGSIGAGELLLIFLVALLVFGAKRLPEIARGLGQGIREFKNATREITREFDVEPPRSYTPAHNALPRRDATAPPVQTPAPAALAPVTDEPSDTTTGQASVA